VVLATDPLSTTDRMKERKRERERERERKRKKEREKVRCCNTQEDIVVKSEC